jgi:hypothetical protein
LHVIRQTLPQMMNKSSLLGGAFKYKVEHLEVLYVTRDSVLPIKPWNTKAHVGLVHES